MMPSGRSAGTAAASSVLIHKSPIYDAERNVGAGLLAKVGCQSTHQVTETPPSRASPLPHKPRPNYSRLGSGNQASLDQLGLLVSVVRGTHQRAGRHVLEAHFVTFLGEPGEGVRVHKTLHRQVAARRLQVLAQGQHVDVVFAHALHDFDHFFVGFAQAQHQAGFGRNVRHHLLEALQQGQRPLVIRTRTRSLVQARHGFQVVVEHIWWLGGSDFQRHVHAPTVIRDQGFELHVRRQLADLTDAIGKVLGTAVTQVIAVHRSDHHVLEFQVGNGDGQAFRFVDVQWLRTTVADVAERAATGADVAHDHEGHGAAGEALAQVRAGHFFADAVQLVFAQQGLDAVDFRGNRDTHANPVGFAWELIGRDYFHRNPRNLLGATQFDADFHFYRGFYGRLRQCAHMLLSLCGNGAVS